MQHKQPKTMPGTPPERRNRERRQFGPAPEYPFYDAEGTLVDHNRRRVVDRRMDSLRDRGSSPLHGLAKPEMRLATGEQTVTMGAGGQVRAGRNQECELVVLSDYTSRDHASFHLRGNLFWIEDHSTNGTYVLNGRGRQVHLRGTSMRLDGEGWIGLGRPPEKGHATSIRFRVREDGPA